MDVLTFLSVSSDTPVSEAAAKAAIGFAVVLAVLALLVGIFYLIGFLFQTKVLSRNKLFERKKKDAPKKPDQAAGVEEENDEEFFAVISAVISAIYDEEAQGDDVKPEFVIRRVRRKK